MNRVINLFAGPGTGKSTTCAALFAELKYCGHNTELITEYAKDTVWEKRGPKVLEAQEYIFGKQHFRLSRVASEVEFVVTDSPILLSCIYLRDNYLPSLKNVVKEAFDKYDNLNIFLKRNKTYNPKGRMQTEDEAKVIDGRILEMLNNWCIEYTTLDFHRDNPNEIMNLMFHRGWIEKPKSVAHMSFG